MKPAHLQRPLQHRGRRARKMQRRGQQEPAAQVQKPLHSQPQPRHPPAQIRRASENRAERSLPRHPLAEARSVQALVAPQQLVHAARAEAEARAQILQPGLAEVHQVGGHLGGLAGKLHGGEKHRQLPVALADQVGQQAQRLRVLDLAHERHELAPVESLAQGHQVQQHLFQPLRLAAAIARLRQREHRIA